MIRHETSTHLTRRQALRLLGIGAGVTLLAACGQNAQPAPTSAPAKPAAPAAQSAATTAPAKPAEAAKPAEPTPANQQAPAKTGGTVSLRFFFWTGSEEESQFWQQMAADASKAVGN